jgi:predicted phosphodiesterase
MTKFAFISDVHGNYFALISTLNFIMRDLKISRQTTRCLGDIVGYYPYPNECVEMIRDLEILSCKGNHDHGSSDDTEPLVGWGEHSKVPVLYARDQLKPENKAFLQTLAPGYHEEKCAWYHSNPVNPFDFFTYLPDDLEKIDTSTNKPIIAASELVQAMEKPVLFVAHAHLPSITTINPANPENFAVANDPDTLYNSFKLAADRKYLINIGAVGQPRDKDPRSCLVVYDDEAQTVQFYRVAMKPEDLQTVQDLTRKTFPQEVEIRGKMQVLGNHLADRLAKGE